MKKIRRVVSSSLAGEALALVDTVGEMVYMKAVLVHVFGEQAEEISMIVVW